MSRTCAIVGDPTPLSVLGSCTINIKGKHMTFVDENPSVTFKKEYDVDLIYHDFETLIKNIPKGKTHRIISFYNSYSLPEDNDIKKMIKLFINTFYDSFEEEASFSVGAIFDDYVVDFLTPHLKTDFLDLIPTTDITEVQDLVDLAISSFKSIGKSILVTRIGSDPFIEWVIVPGANMSVHQPTPTGLPPNLKLIFFLRRANEIDQKKWFYYRNSSYAFRLISDTFGDVETTWCAHLIPDVPLISNTETMKILEGASVVSSLHLKTEPSALFILSTELSSNVDTGDSEDDVQSYYPGDTSLMDGEETQGNLLDEINKILYQSNYDDEFEGLGSNRAGRAFSSFLNRRKIEEEEKQYGAEREREEAERLRKAKEEEERLRMEEEEAENLKHLDLGSQFRDLRNIDNFDNLNRSSEEWEEMERRREEAEEARKEEKRRQWAADEERLMSERAQAEEQERFKAERLRREKEERERIRREREEAERQRSERIAGGQEVLAAVGAVKRRIIENQVADEQRPDLARRSTADERRAREEKEKAIRTAAFGARKAAADPEMSLAEKRAAAAELSPLRAEAAEYRESVKDEIRALRREKAELSKRSKEAAELIPSLREIYIRMHEENRARKAELLRGRPTKARVEHPEYAEAEAMLKAEIERVRKEIASKKLYATHH